MKVASVGDALFYEGLHSLTTGFAGLHVPLEFNLPFSYSTHLEPLFPRYVTFEKLPGLCFLLLLLVLNHDEVVRAVASHRNRSAVAVQELDGHVGSVLGEERNSLVTSLDGLNHLPTGSVLADEVGLS